MDVVYILASNGSHWRNNEIRYSLRSLQKHLKGYRNIYVIGEKPAWLNNVIHVRADDPYKYNKEANICNKIKIACEHPDISDDFLFINDDHFFLQDTNINEILPYSKKDADLHPSRETNLNKYELCRLNTWRALKEKGLTTYLYDIHTPIIYNKKKFLEVIKQYPWDNDDIGFVVKSMYGNTLDLGHFPYKDCKIDKEVTKEQIDEKLADRWIWSIGDHALSPVTIKYIDELYPIASKYEKSPVAISVIIPLYNQGEYLDECIHSVMAQQFTDFEVIIVDDCSTDNSYQIAQNLAEQSSKIRVYKNEKNRGVCYTRNKAISYANGEYIVPLDADDRIHDEYLNEVYSNKDKADIIYTNTVKFGTVSSIDNKIEYNFEELKKWNLINVTAMFKKSHWQEVGGYDENIKNLEDWEFWLRMGMFGHFGYRVPRPLFYYRKKGFGRFKESRPIRPEIKKYIYSKLGLR